MTDLSRRNFAFASAAAGLAALMPGHVFAQGATRRFRVVVVGGGFGGATTARYLKMLDPGIAVTLVEPSQNFVTCPFSNLVLGGLKTMPQITHSYAGARRAGVQVVHDMAAKVERLSGKEDTEQ